MEEAAAQDERREWAAQGWADGAAAPQPSFPVSPYRHSVRRRYRHSRVSGNPTVACRQYHYKAVPFGIPAHAGMTAGGRGNGGFYYGKDGCIGNPPRNNFPGTIVNLPGCAIL